MTHQDIVESMAALSVQCREEQALVRKRYVPLFEALREKCGRVGHVFSDQTGYSFGPQRTCCICGAVEGQRTPAVFVPVRPKQPDGSPVMG